MRSNLASKLCFQWVKLLLAPYTEEELQCHQCGSAENLWVCLICGYVGCGRYAHAHAVDHWKAGSLTPVSTFQLNLSIFVLSMKPN